MTRAVDRMLTHSEELAAWFRHFDPKGDSGQDPMAVAELCSAIFQRAESERQLIAAIKRARAAGFSWHAIGKFVGTTGEAARQRYAESMSS